MGKNLRTSFKGAPLVIVTVRFVLKRSTLIEGRQNWIKNDRLIPIKCSRAKVAFGPFCAN